MTIKNKDYLTNRIVAMLETSLHNMHLAKMALQSIESMPDEYREEMGTTVRDLRSTLEWIEAELIPTKPS